MNPGVELSTALSRSVPTAPAMCEHEERRERIRAARNESGAPAVAIVGKQSPYNPGEM